MDAHPTYEMSPRKVRFVFVGAAADHSASITGDAIEYVVGRELQRASQHLDAYRAHWKLIHRLAMLKLHFSQEQVVVYLADVQRTGQHLARARTLAHA